MALIEIFLPSDRGACSSMICGPLKRRKCVSLFQSTSLHEFAKSDGRVRPKAFGWQFLTFGAKGVAGGPARCLTNPGMESSQPVLPADPALTRRGKAIA